MRFNIPELGDKVEMAGKIAGKVGLTALTLAVPPAGGALWFNDSKKRIIGTLGGVALSVLFNACGPGNNVLYKGGELEVTAVPVSSGRDLFPILGFVSSPASFYLTTEPGVSVKNGGNIYYASGDNLLEFDSDQRRYSLNFDEDTSFNSNVTKLRSISEYKSALDSALAEGNIIDAEEARANYEGALLRYAETRSAYEGAVNKMNQKLEDLSMVAQGE